MHNDRAAVARRVLDAWLAAAVRSRITVVVQGEAKLRALQLQQYRKMLVGECVETNRASGAKQKEDILDESDYHSN